MKQLLRMLSPPFCLYFFSLPVELKCNLLCVLGVVRSGTQGTWFISQMKEKKHFLSGLRLESESLEDEVCGR